MLPRLNDFQQTRIPILTGRPRITDDAEPRRRALRKALAAANMTPADAAREAGLPSPNAIYNFFSERTKSLSLDTYAALAKVIPGASIASLKGDDVASAPISRAVMVRAEARAGALRDTFELPPGEQTEASVPIDPSMRAAGAFAVRVRHPGAEELYPDNTTLVVMPVSSYEGTLKTGRRVVLQRIHADTVEVTVRELDVRDGVAWLWPKSTHPKHIQPVKMPWPFSADRMWRSGEDRFSVAGIVVGAYIPEDE